MKQAQHSKAMSIALLASGAIVYPACGTTYDDVYTPLTIPSGENGGSGAAGGGGAGGSMTTATGATGVTSGTGGTGVTSGTGGMDILKFRLEWSRPGDLDLHVTTPNGRTINHSNKGPNASTDYGQLDKDDEIGTGPENVFWAQGNAPPLGTYHLCAETFKSTPFNPPLSSADPVHFTVTVYEPPQAPQTFTGTYTGNKPMSGMGCDSTASTYVTSITYP